MFPLIQSFIGIPVPLGSFFEELLVHGGDIPTLNQKPVEAKCLGSIELFLEAPQESQASHPAPINFPSKFLGHGFAP